LPQLKFQPSYKQQGLSWSKAFLWSILFFGRDTNIHNCISSTFWIKTKLIFITNSVLLNIWFTEYCSYEKLTYSKHGVSRGLRKVLIKIHNYEYNNTTIAAPAATSTNNNTDNVIVRIIDFFPESVLFFSHWINSLL